MMINRVCFSEAQSQLPDHKHKRQIKEANEEESVNKETGEEGDEGNGRTGKTGRGVDTSDGKSARASPHFARSIVCLAS